MFLMKSLLVNSEMIPIIYDVNPYSVNYSNPAKLNGNSQ